MAGSMNKVLLIGRLGNDPEPRTFQNGGGVVSFSLATSERWTDRTSGERQERTEWHRVSVFTEGLRDVVEKYLSKGDLVSIEGKLETRKWTDAQGTDHYSTEVVLRPFRGELIMLGSPNQSGDREARGEAGASAEGGERPAQGNTRGRGRQRARAGAAAGAGGGSGWDAPKADLDDDVPF
ncbi:single-stranded DNA-binding protein [Roseomonas sp. KE2513]|uniref:single-stranded DNA-binding protein n=1 Tax=Roseomonas sp. KE2513 TaxID=2479202 RepID=UPI0018E028B6|nr:single-stranded DNA-binding protein [Roseomonas sp. KE2513]MBI0538732.1 single-stranded DNA-binding protein [Roseomonas sp. KE2513]